MPSDHAKLSPSSASRWMACTPSAHMAMKFPNKTSKFAEEGTLAHSVAELILRSSQDIITLPQFNTELRILEKHEQYSEDLFEHADSFADLVLANKPATASLFIEQRLDITNYIPEGFGTSDATVIDGRRMKIFDLKYGQGIPVFAEWNKQMMVYALGALNDFGFIFEIEIIELHIFQPRLDSHSMWEISVVDLLHWADTELKEKAKMAYLGEGEVVPGDHCQFCPCKPTCKGLHDYQMELAKSEFKDGVWLTDFEVRRVLERKQTFLNWINSVEEYALQEALNGRQWPGFKVVQGKSNRIYKDPEEVEKTLKDLGKTDIYTEPKLLGITALTKKIGKATFDTVVNPLCIKPEGKPALVPESDKRPAKTSAKDEFDDGTDDLM